MPHSIRCLRPETGRCPWPLVIPQFSWEIQPSPNLQLVHLLLSVFNMAALIHVGIISPMSYCTYLLMALPCPWPCPISHPFFPSKVIFLKCKSNHFRLKLKTHQGVFLPIALKMMSESFTQVSKTLCELCRVLPHSSPAPPQSLPLSVCGALIPILCLAASCSPWSSVLDAISSDRPACLPSPNKSQSLLQITIMGLVVYLFRTSSLRSFQKVMGHVFLLPGSIPLPTTMAWPLQANAFWMIGQVRSLYWNAPSSDHFISNLRAVAREQCFGWEFLCTFFTFSRAHPMKTFGLA